jgi:hypothetical protein
VKGSPRIPLALAWTAIATVGAVAGATACSSSGSSGTSADASTADVAEDVTGDTTAPTRDAVALLEAEASTADVPDVGPPPECEAVSDSGISFFQSDAAECPDGDPTIAV